MENGCIDQIPKFGIELKRQERCAPSLEVSALLRKRVPAVVGINALVAGCLRFSRMPHTSRDWHAFRWACANL